MGAVAETLPDRTESKKEPERVQSKLWVRDERIGNILLPERVEAFVVEAKMLLKPEFRPGLVVHKVAATIYDSKGLKTDVDSYLQEGPSAKSPEDLTLEIRFLSAKAVYGGLRRRQLRIDQMSNRQHPGLGEPSYAGPDYVKWESPKPNILVFGAHKDQYVPHPFVFNGLCVHNCHTFVGNTTRHLNLNLKEMAQESAVYVYISLKDQYRNLQNLARGLKGELAKIEGHIKGFEKAHIILPPLLVKQPEPPSEQNTAPEYTQRRGEY